MNNPFFSIIIPTYNRAAFIDKTITSLLNQTYTNFEIIVVDDGSTDNTEEVIKSIVDSRISYFKKENAERGAARNYGAKNAKGTYFNFFDSDDLAYSNHLEEASRLIQKEKSASIFALGYDIKSPQGKLLRKRTLFKNINQQIIYGNLLSCNGVFIKKEIALNNPFSVIRELSASEDYLLWLQLASKFTYVYSNISTSVIIEHDNRSVLNINPNNLIKRKELMLKMALEDKYVVTFYGAKIKYLKANTYSYIALHLAMSDCKKQAISYLFKALQMQFTFIFTKRFLATTKHLIF